MNWLRKEVPLPLAAVIVMTVLILIAALYWRGTTVIKRPPQYPAVDPTLTFVPPPEKRQQPKAEGSEKSHEGAPSLGE